MGCPYCTSTRSVSIILTTIVLVLDMYNVHSLHAPQTTLNFTDLQVLDLNKCNVACDAAASLYYTDCSNNKPTWHTWLKQKGLCQKLIYLCKSKQYWLGHRQQCAESKGLGEVKFSFTKTEWSMHKESKTRRDVHGRMPYLMLFLASETALILYKSSTLSFSCFLV